MACTKFAMFTDEKILVSREMINFLSKVHVREIAFFFHEASGDVGMFVRTSKNFTRASKSKGESDCLSIFEATFLSPKGCRRGDLEEHFAGIRLFEEYVKLQPGFQLYPISGRSEMRGGYVFEVKNDGLIRRKYRRARCKETEGDQQLASFYE